MSALSPISGSGPSRLSHPALGSTRLIQLGNVQLEVQTEVERGRRLVTCAFARGRVVARRIFPLPQTTVVDAHLLHAAVKSEQKEIVGDILDRLREKRAAV